MNNEVSCDWFGAINDCVCEQWKKNKFINLLKNHKKRYPTFEEGYAAMRFLNADEKTKGWMCYQPVSRWSKDRKKSRSIRRLAFSQD